MAPRAPTQAFCTRNALLVGPPDDIANRINLETPHMRNLAPSVLSALPHVHPIAEYERAFNARRVTLATQADAQLLAARQLFARVEAELAEPAEPTMAHITSDCSKLYRSQPRDGRGRFVSRSWLRQAETFTAADLAWFRHPVSEER